MITTDNPQYRRTWLAVDGAEDFYGAQALIDAVAKGPMSPYMAGVKFNDGLHTPWGKTIVDYIYDEYPDLMPFIDFKGVDIESTMINTVKRYYRDAPLMATVSVHVAAETFITLRREFPKLQVAAMGIPTDMSKEQCVRRYGDTPANMMQLWYGNLCRETALAPHFVTNPTEYAIGSLDMIPMYLEHFAWLKPTVPGVRDHWMVNQTGDVQKRITGTKEALEAGAYYLVMGAQLFKGNPGKSISAAESQDFTSAEFASYFAGLAA